MFTPLFLCLIAFVFAEEEQTPPNLSNDFSTDCIYQLQNGNQPARKFNVCTKKFC
jgi:hypothetical protein